MNQIVNKKKKIIIILSIIVLIGLSSVFFIGVEDIKITAGVILRNEVFQHQRMCKTQCQSQNMTFFCCDPKWIEKYEYHTCKDDLLDIECELDCGGVCEDYCAGYEYMIPCSRAGCTWLPVPRICKARYS